MPERHRKRRRVERHDVLVSKSAVPGNQRDAVSAGAHPPTTKLQEFLRAPITKKGLAHPLNNIASMIHTLTLSDITDESKKNLHKPIITKTCLKKKARSAPGGKCESSK